MKKNIIVHGLALTLLLAGCGRSEKFQISASSLENQSGPISFSDSMKTWTKNYQEIVTLLKKTQSVGNCAVSLATDSNSPEGSWRVTVLQRPEGAASMTIIPPKATNGRSQVDYINWETIRYRQSDIAGWTNLFVYLKEKAIVGMEANKTLPNDSVYSVGFVCGKTNL